MSSGQIRMSLSAPGGVVERASKEISRRIHSLGFKTSSSSSSSSSTSSSRSSSQPPTTSSRSLSSERPAQQPLTLPASEHHQVELGNSGSKVSSPAGGHPGRPSSSNPAEGSNRANRSNGQNLPRTAVPDGGGPGTVSAPGSPVMLATIKSRPNPPPKPCSLASSSYAGSGPAPDEAIARGNGANLGGSSPAEGGPIQKAPNQSSTAVRQARTMGSIIKGSVMDKVTHVFNSSGSNGSRSGSSSSSSSSTPCSPPAPAGGDGSSTSTAPATATSSTLTTSSTENIPKGAVANGRAKFEAAQSAVTTAGSKGSSGSAAAAANNQDAAGKTMRFFGGRSRTNSPMLPVRTPKVPPLPQVSSAVKPGGNPSTNGDRRQGPPSSDTAGRTSPSSTRQQASPPAADPDQQPKNGTEEVAKPAKGPKVLTIPKRYSGWEELWQDYGFLVAFFSRFSNVSERSALGQVCRRWREVLYQPVFWREVRPVLHCRTIRCWSSSAMMAPSSSSTTSGATAAEAAENENLVQKPETESVALKELDKSDPASRTSNTAKAPVEAAESATLPDTTSLEEDLKSVARVKARMKSDYFESLRSRGFDTFCLLNANDNDVFDFIQNLPSGSQGIQSLVLRCCSLSDKGLEALLEFLQGLYSLEIVGCNEITEQGLWSSLNPRLVALTISDCINVADECVCAVTQLLPALNEFNLQAYHVTDSALAYFSPKQTATLNVLRLQSCWEITNHGIVNIVHTLPNLTVLSLSGCSKITDDGIELIAENLRKLRSLDISWCPRVTDAALEYIACDLNHLEELTLDRCIHVTDIGIGYISTMLAIHTLFLRWCTQIRDFGLQHICGMRSMQVLSLAGCPLITSSGLSNLIQLRHLHELELTNCPGASPELIEYLRQNLVNCLVLD